MEESKKQIMLISWKWSDFRKTGSKVTNELLQQLNWLGEQPPISQYQGKLFDEFTVSDQLPNGENRPITPAAKIVRVNIENEINNTKANTFQFLLQLIQYYQQDDVELFIFLHRKDGFGDQEISEILRHKKGNNCFLIGGGRDYIYYDPNRLQGLLGDNGRFYSRGPIGDKPAIKVASEKGKMVFQPHFDKVWSYYKFEFYTKILELREDLMAHWIQLNAREDSLERDSLGSLLAEEEKLYLRVKNFISDSKLQLSKKEEERLEKLEESDHKSYVFDDCRINLALTENIVKEFDKVSRFLRSILKGESGLSNGMSNGQILVKINRQFNALLIALAQTSEK